MKEKRSVGPWGPAIWGWVVLGFVVAVAVYPVPMWAAVIGGLVWLAVGSLILIKGMERAGY